MWPVSDRFLAASAGGGELVTKIWAEAPGGERVDLTWLDNPTFTKSLEAGSRWQAQATVVDDVNGAAFEVLTTPGAIVGIDHGFRFSRNSSELIPAGRYEVARRPARTIGTSISVDLVDQWGRLEECRFTTPLTVSSGTARRAAILSAVSAAIPDVVVVDRAPAGGNLGATVTFEDSRTDMVNTLARDGGLDAAFTADGSFDVRPDFTIGEPVRVFTDADGAGPGWVSDEAVYTRLYNCVVVSSSASTPLFAPPVVIHISDPAHPRHRSKIGVRPYRFPSPTISNRSIAASAGIGRLNQIAQPVQRVRGSSFGLAYLEPGDTILLAAFPDTPFLLETVSHDCGTGASTFEGRSVSEIPAEEEG